MVVYASVEFALVVVACTNAPPPVLETLGEPVDSLGLTLAGVG